MARRRLGVTLAFVDVASVPQGYDHDQQDLIFDGVQNAIVADSYP
jgi:hypothetical protein